MPLTIKAPQRQHFAPLLHKLERRLDGWKARFISRAEKLQLVKTVLSTIPSYFMSCFKLPEWLISRIDSIRREFLWNRYQTHKPVHLVNWQLACLPIVNGGLGIVNLRLHNMALLLRWCWRLFTNDNRLWRTYATLIHASRPSVDGTLMLSRTGSFFWKSILSFKLLFFSCAQFRLLSGRQVSFWFDGWAGQPLKQSNLNTLTHKAISVHDAKYCFHQLLPGPLTLQQNEAYQKITEFVPDHGRDELVWNLEPSGSFSVKSAYKVLAQGGKTWFMVPSIWKIRVTPSIKLFFFFLLNGRLLTHDVMQRRHINHTEGCVLCAQGSSETAMHLFFQCPFSQQIWSSPSSAAGYTLIRPTETPLDTFLLSAPRDRARLPSWRVTFLTITWLIWKERNHRTFRNVSTPPQALATNIQHEAGLYLKYC